MRTNSENIKTIVAVFFAALCILALGASLFAQEVNGATKNERTKIITLKIVEDENGKVTKVDTTFTFEGEDQSDQFFYWNDENNLQYDLSKLDSMMFNFKFEGFSLDSIEKSMIFINSKMEEEIKGLEKDLEKMRSYEFKIVDSMENCSMKQIWVTVDDGINDSIIGNNIRMIKSNNDKIVIIGSPAATISTDDQNIIISSEFDDETGRQMKTVTVSSEVNTEDSDGKTITVIINDDDVDTMETEGEKTVVIRKSIVTVVSSDDATVEELKSAGIKEENGELEPVDLKFAPNPNQGNFNLSFTLKDKNTVTINIFDINGKLIYTETLKDFEGTYNKEIDISNNGTGPYFLQIIQGIYDLVRKIIIQ